MRKILLIILVFSALHSQAQIEFKCKTSKDAVLLGEPFILEFELNTNFENFTLPEFEHFKVISGPNTSMQQSINMVNGEMIKKISVKYSYYIKALNPGTHTIPAAEIVVDGNYYYSSSTDVIVIDMDYVDPNKHKGKDIEGTQKL